MVLTGADQQLLHGGVLASLPGVGGGDAALAVQDAVVQHASACVGMLRDVGSMVVSEPAVWEVVTPLS